MWSILSQVGALEGQMFLQTGRLANLSVQQLVDCSFENGGCDGGLPSLAFEFVERTGGLTEEDNYRPYNATVSERHQGAEQCSWGRPNLANYTKFIFHYSVQIPSPW